MTDTITRNRDIRYELVAESATDFASETPLRLLRRTLRDRYHFVIVVALSLALLGGIVGYCAVKPTYQSTGLVRIEGALPAILYESPENQVPPLFDSFIASQVTYLQGRPVLDVAVTLPEMQEAGWPGGSIGVARLQDALTVTRGRGEQVISVAVTQADPTIAQTAANAVLAAYEQVYANEGEISSAAREAALVSREQQLNDELRQLRENVLTVSEQYGAEAIERMHTSTVEELIAIDQKIAELDIVKARMELEGDGVETAIAGRSHQLSALDEQELALLAEIESLRNTYSPGHSRMRELNRQVEVIRIQKDLRARALADIATDLSQSFADGQAIPEAPIHRISLLEARYQEMKAELREEAARRGSQRVAIVGLNERITEIRDRLGETRRRLDEQRVESNRDTVNRISIAARADLPVSPIRDRRQGLAAACSLFGAVAGVTLVFLFGLVDPRIRFAEEIEAIGTAAPILGILPVLDHENPDSRTRAARTVHQLRNLLELQSAQPGRNVHAVTSAGQGDGKTSLTLGLGASFAAAGRRTLIIDAHVSRGKLTDELGLRGQAGLCEAIGPAPGSGQVHRTRQENLWAMPLGAAQGVDAEDLSRDRLIWLLDALRQRFDLIIIDTGSILSSVEASLVTAVADRTIVTVRRSQRKDLLRAALRRLDQIGATCAGIVFNRAAASDFRNLESHASRSTGRIVPLVGSSPALRENVGPFGIAIHREASRRAVKSPSVLKRAA